MAAKILIPSTLLILFFSLNIQAQINFSNDPLEAKFITEDVQRFWECFDKLDSSSTNPFNEYVEKGWPGVKGFMMGRIVNADSLYQMVALLEMHAMVSLMAQNRSTFRQCLLYHFELLQGLLGF